MSAEQRIMVAVTRVDMFLTAYWPALMVVVILLLGGIATAALLRDE